MKLLIVRHGETVDNAKKIIQGQSQGNLSKLGKSQSQRLTNRLTKEKIDIIYCSDLRRCKQTIEPLLKSKKVPIIYTKALRERDFGIFNGKPSEEFHKWLSENNYENNFSFKMPKGESFQDLKKRVRKFLNNLLKKEKGKNVLIVTHGGTKVALMLTLFNKDEKTHYKKYRAKNTSLSIVYIKDNGIHRARLLNSIKHLI